MNASSVVDICREKVKPYARFRHPVSLVFAMSWAFTLWLILYPTVYSPDAFYILLDASDHAFSDMHPLLVPWALSGALRIGLGTGAVVLMQLLLGLLGIRQLVIACLRLLEPRGAKIADCIAMGVLGLLASPLTPLPIYLATIWTDTWLAIFLIWTIALLVGLNEAGRGGVAALANMAVIVTLSALSILVRYNAAAVYPLLAIAFFGALKRNAVRPNYSLVLVLIPLFLAGSVLIAQYRTVRIRYFHPERAVYALDLASMITHDPSICQNLSLQSCDLVSEQFTPEFEVGNGAINLTFNEGREYFYDPFLALFLYPRLDEEFRIAAFANPMLLAQVKLLNLWDYLRPHPNMYFFSTSIVSKDVIRLPAQKFASPLSPWFLISERIIADPVLIWFSYVHVVWLVVNLLGLIALGVYGWGFHNKAAVFGWKILLIPASYYGSYLIAFTTAEFRFMFPSMLIVQVPTLTFLCYLVARQLDRIRGRAVRPMDRPSDVPAAAG